MKLFLILALLLSFSVKGQNVLVEGKKANTNIKLPTANQATDLGRNQVLIETGNTNLLKNPSFESSVNGESWTVSTVSGDADCTLGSAASLKDQYGKKHLLAECSGVGVVEISQTVSTAKASMIASIFALKNASSGKVELVTYSDSEQNTQAVSYPEDDESYLKKMSTIDFPSGETNTKIAIRITRESGDAVMLLRLDLAYLGMSEVTFSSIKMDSDWKSYGPITIGATITAPTKGTTTTDDVSCRQDGDMWECRYIYSQTSAGGSGSGNYLLALPTGIVFDDSVPNFSGAMGATISDGMAPSFIGQGYGGILGGSQGDLYASKYSSTHFRVFRKTIYSSTASWGGVFGLASPQGIYLSIKFKGKGLRSNLDVLTSAAKFEDMKNHESFSFTVDGLLSPSPVTQTLPFVVDGSGDQQCTRPSAGAYHCPTPSLTSVPACTTARRSSSGSGVSPIHSPSSTPTNQIFHTRGPNADSFNMEGFSITCTKTGNDLKVAFQKKLSAALHAKNIVGMARYIVNKHQSGDRSYEVYSDGWVVQRMFQAQSAADLNLMVQMRDGGYFVTTATNYNSGSSFAGSHQFVTARGTSNFTMAAAPTATVRHTWVVKGYGDSTVVKSHGATPDY